MSNLKEPKAIITHNKPAPGLGQAVGLIKDFSIRKMEKALRDLAALHPEWFAVGALDDTNTLKALRQMLRDEVNHAVFPSSDRVLHLAQTGAWSERGREARIAVLAMLLDYKMTKRMAEVAGEREAMFDGDEL